MAQPGGIPAEKYCLIGGITTVQLLVVSSNPGRFTLCLHEYCKLLMLLKLIALLLFVFSGGAVFTDWGRRNKWLAIAAGTIAIVGSYYLAKDVWSDLTANHRSPTSENQSSGNSNSPANKTEQYSASLSAEYKEILLGRTSGPWSYSKDSTGSYGRVTLMKKEFSPPVVFQHSDVRKIWVWELSGSSTSAITGIDGDGLHTTFYVDRKAMTSVFSKDTANLGVFWSPSGRYVMSINSYEGVHISLLDSQLGIYRNGALLEANGNPLLAVSSPAWADDERHVLLSATEVVDPWSTKPNSGQNVDTHLLQIDVPSLKSKVANSTSPQMK